jgi:hypothetical protein
MPCYKLTNMRFIREYLAGEKSLIKAAEVRVFNIPLYEELTVPKLLEQVKGDSQIMRHLNYYPNQKCLPQREFFFGILGTLAPEYLSNVIKNANRIRNRGDSRDKANETIQVTQEIYDKLNAEPFFSSKMLRYNFQIEQRGKALQFLSMGAKERKAPQKRKRHELSQSYVQYAE